MKCKKCRRDIPDDSKFCNHCGAPQEKKKLYRRPDGLYEKIITIDGKRVAFRARKEADVYKKIREYEAKMETGALFVEVAEAWYKEHWVTLSPTTQMGYQYPYNEIIEQFGDIYIKQLTHKDINEYIKGLPKSYARKTCVTRLQIINMICKYAVLEDIITDNPCSYITVKGHGSKKRRAPTNKEIDIIKSNVDLTFKDFHIGLLAVFMLYIGVRKGEALALTYKDIKRREKRVCITKSVYYTSNEPQIKTPKTEAGNREIVLPDYIDRLLPNGRHEQYIFSPFPESPMKKDFFARAWAYWQKKTGLDLTAHQLRHGYATLLHEADIDVKDAQELLGHADANTTQNIYTEVSQNQKNKVAEKINQFLQ